MESGLTNVGSLTPRQHHIALLVGRGLTNKEIARILGISEGVVKLHVHKILAKLSVKNRYGICLWLVSSTAVGEVDDGGG